MLLAFIVLKKCGKSFRIDAWKEITSGLHLGLSSLISLGTVASFVFGVYSLAHNLYMSVRGSNNIVVNQLIPNTDAGK